MHMVANNGVHQKLKLQGEIMLISHRQKNKQNNVLRLAHHLFIHPISRQQYLAPFVSITSHMLTHTAIRTHLL